MESPTYLYTLRTQLGLTIGELATLMDCHNSAWAMAEIGKRTLPTQARLLVSRLELSMLEAEKDNTASEAERQARQEACLKHLKKAQAKLKKCTLLLEQATEKIAQVTLLLKTLALWATTVLPTDSEEVHLQTQILQRKALKKRTALEAQILALQLDSAGLLAEIAEAEKNLQI